MSDPLREGPTSHTNDFWANAENHRNQYERPHTSSRSRQRALLERIDRVHEDVSIFSGEPRPPRETLPTNRRSHRSRQHNERQRSEAGQSRLYQPPRRAVHDEAARFVAPAAE